MARARRARRCRAPPAPARCRARAGSRRSAATSASSKTPTSWRRAPTGFVSGPSTLKIVRTPSERRTGPAWRIAGWCEGAKRKPKPTSSMQAATASAERSSRTPRASSTSADPDAELTARLPCLATPAPAAAATSPAAVDTLNVLQAVATRAAGVDEVGAPGSDRDRVRPHRAGRADDLVDRLALHAQGHEQPRDLRLAGVAVHHVADHGLGLGLRQRLAPQEAREQRRDHAGSVSARNRCAMRSPCGVRIDSGWNCSPCRWASSR